MNCNLFEDPLDSEDFDAVKYINHRFPTGITSSALLQLFITPPIAAVACYILLYDDPITSHHVTLLTAESSLDDLDSFIATVGSQISTLDEVSQYRTIRYHAVIILLPLTYCRRYPQRCRPKA